MFKRYSLTQLIYLTYCKIRTVFVFSKARIIRFPIDIRGKKFIQISDGFTTGVGCRMEAYPVDDKQVLFIDENFQMNDYVHITAMTNITIGKNVLLASKVYISDCSHGSYAGDQNDTSPVTAPSERKMFSKPVIIHDNVWLGEFVSVLPGVIIGEGSIIGANSVVSKDIPQNVIAVGSPAKPIKKYNFDTQRWERIKII